MNESLFSSSSSLLCFVCNSPFQDPRLLPCQHSFCLKCINFLCENPTSDSRKKIKLVCPKCTTHFTVPLKGVESFPVDVELKALKNKIIDQVAQNISNDVKFSKKTSKEIPNSTFDKNSTSFSANPLKKDTMNYNGYSSLNKDYSKYAKYFEASSEQTNFKPTIRPNHAKVSYESSTRFRNRQRSKERDKPDEYRRRTWYGPALESRRAQSLCRSSTYTENTTDPTSSENLYKISEDKEHAMPSRAEKATFRHSMYADYRDINIMPTSTASSIDPPKAHESPFSRRANLGGPSRPTLSTHRENITSDDASRCSKERRNLRVSPSRGEVKYAYKSRKNSPKLSREKKRVSLSPSPQRKRVLRNVESNEEVRLEDEEAYGGRMDRRQQFLKEERLREAASCTHQQTVSPPRHSRPEDVSSKKQRSRCRSMDARPKSLKKEDFQSASDFKRHLLGMTMKKDSYENIMQNISNIQEYDEEEEEEEEEEIHTYEETYTEEDKENQQQRKKAEALIDDDLISSLRTKYSSSLHCKKSPRHSAVAQLAAGVVQAWSYQKTDCGLPSSAIFLSSGALVVADYGHSSLEFLDCNGHFEHCISGIKPFGMAINRSNETFIVGDRKGRNMRVFDEFGADVSQIDEFNSVEWLGGVAVRRDGGLVLCDRSKSRIIVCGFSGAKVREFGSYGNNRGQLCMADFVAVDSRDRVIVADSGNHCLKIFDSNTGDLLEVVGERGGGEGQFEWPKGVAVDKRDNIFVADTLNRRVVKLSSEGVFIKCIASNIPEPYNLAYHAGRLAVLHRNLKGTSTCDVYDGVDGV